MFLKRKWCLILIFLLVEVYSRPQNAEAPPSVELKKETGTDPKTPTETTKTPVEELKKIDDKTSDILEKIAEVNKKHGLETRNKKIELSKSTFGLPRSQDQNTFTFPNSLQGQQLEETARSDFKFPVSPFSNPILELLEREKVQNNDENRGSIYEISNRQSQDITPSQGYEIVSTNHNAEITEEDLVPGQTVKRKIVHQQTILVPNPNYGLQNPAGYQIPFQYPVPSNSPALFKPNSDNSNGDHKYLSNLEKQTISNVRNIVSNSQNQAYPSYYNPYVQPVEPIPNQNKLYTFIVPSKTMQELPAALGQTSGNNYNVYVPYPTSNPESGRQNWNWPGANYFPVYIKDPFLQMYNAITTMIEYGPNAGNQNPCKGGRNPTQNRVKDILLREAKHSDDTKISVKVDGTNSAPQISLNGDGKNGTYLDIENIDIGSSGDSSLKFTLNLKKEEREVKDDDDIGTGRTAWDQIKVTGKSNALVLQANSSNSRHSSKFPANFHKDLKPLTVVKNQVGHKPTSASVISPPSRDPTHQTNEFGEESEEEKSEEIISNDNNKKLFSRDNTGSGVFIHRLKVRKGGVAIAGPGGIATAGSGGTAIVGPGGVAYTQPDSLAIAGSGTKVVAVDPSVNLGDLVNAGLGNKTKLDTAFPPSRVGKVVAVGPVVYYNKG